VAAFNATKLLERNPVVAPPAPPPRIIRL